MTAAVFKYKAETLEGEQVRGLVEAPSPNAARNQLAMQGIRVIDLRQKKGISGIEVTQTKVKKVELMHFSRQMSTFVRAGVPLIEAIRIIRRESKNRTLQRTLSDLIERLQDGQSLADAVAAHREVFPPFYVGILQAAELTGNLDQAFLQLTAYLKRDIDISRKIKGALTYPIILFIIAMAAVLVIVLFAMPRFEDFFASFDAQLPLPTRMLLSTSRFIGSWWWLILILMIGTVAGFLVVIQTPRGRLAYHKALLSIPMVRYVTQFAITERFCRVLSTMLDAGVPLPESFATATEGTNNLVFQNELARAREGMMAGDGIADPIIESGLFPSTIAQMIRVGEETGTLDEQLMNAAVFLEDELSYSLEKLTAWFEPITIVFIGLMVGFVALALVSAMYGIYNQVEI